MLGNPRRGGMGKPMNPQVNVQRDPRQDTGMGRPMGPQVNVQPDPMRGGDMGKPMGGGMGAGPTQGPDPAMMGQIQQMVGGTPQGGGGMPNPSPGGLPAMGPNAQTGGMPQGGMPQGGGGMPNFAPGTRSPMKKGGVVKVSSASSRADGCATKGKTKGRFV